MKYKILLYGLIAVVVTSCSSAYKATQTPDDVYYSPARVADVAKETRKQDKYEDYTRSEDDSYLRMKIRNRDRWSTIDDYEYWNDTRYTPYYSYNYYRNNWNNPYTWNTWSNPYYFPYYNSGISVHNYYFPQYGYSPYTNVYVIKNPTRVTGTTRPNLNGYGNNNYNNTNSTRFSNTLKRVFTPTENTYNNRNSTTNSGNSTYTAPTRTYTPSSSSSSTGSSSSGSSSSGGGVSRPTRN